MFARKNLVPRLFNVPQLLLQVVEVIKIEYKVFYDYDVYEDGRIFSHKTNKFLLGDSFSGYLMYKLSINGESRKFKAHRLVAMLWLENPNNLPIVNHIDGNKMNNHYSNLEWCTTHHNNKHARETGLNNVAKSNHDRWQDDEFRERVSQKMSQTLTQRGSVRHRNNPRFKYEIFDKKGKEYTRTELATLIKRSQSNTDAKIKKAANGDVIEDFVRFGITVKNIKE